MSDLLFNPAILTALICGFFLLIVVILFYGMYRTTKNAKRSFAAATPASAKILTIGESSASAHYGDVIVDLILEITPPAGQPYQESVSWSVQPASVSKLKEGLPLKIRIDNKNHKKIYSAEKWLSSLNTE